jgi:hypothetical protein
MFFRAMREKKKLHLAFKEASAIASWITIQVLEKNQGYFQENIEIFNNIHDQLNSGLSFSEKSNHRVAYMYFREAIKMASTSNQKLLTQHDDILEALHKLKSLTDTVIDPLWLKYYAGK